jgi:hypothetical protein
MGWVGVLNERTLVMFKTKFNDKEIRYLQDFRFLWW